MTKEMTEGSPLRLIFNFSLPLILGSLLQQTYSLIDAAIVRKIFRQSIGLAAVGCQHSRSYCLIHRILHRRAVAVSAFLWLRRSVHVHTATCGVT